MQLRIVLQFAVQLEPQFLVGRLWCLIIRIGTTQGAKFERTEAVQPTLHALGHVVEFLARQQGHGRHVLRRRHVRHVELVLEAVLRNLKGGSEREDGAAVLDGHDPTRAETPAVTAPVNVVNDRRIGVAGAQEVSMERVRQAPLDGIAGRQQGLSQHLAAKHALGADVAAGAAEQVDLERFQLHQAQQLPESVRLAIHRTPPAPHSDTVIALLLHRLP